jgi:hypothetical protein
MKTWILFLLLICRLNGYSQYQINLWFYDGCESKIVALPYEANFIEKEYTVDSVVTHVENMGVYTFSTATNHKDYKRYFSFNKQISGNISDTIYLSKISLTNDGALHSPNTNFKYCGRVCDGYEIDYDSNHVKRVEGYFVNGWPEGKIKYYNSDGKLMKVETYRRKKLKRVTEKE